MPIDDGIPRVDIRRWRVPLSWNVHGVAKRKVAPATSSITEMVYLVASDTRLVRWHSRACCVLGYTLSRRLGRTTACYAEMALKLPQPR